MTTDTTNLAEAPDRTLALELVRVTEAAARRQCERTMPRAGRS